VQFLYNKKQPFKKLFFITVDFWFNRLKPAVLKKVTASSEQLSEVLGGVAVACACRHFQIYSLYNLLNMLAQLLRVAIFFVQNSSPLFLLNELRWFGGIVVFGTPYKEMRS
jgi:hypothetical protein